MKKKICLFLMVVLTMAFVSCQTEPNDEKETTVLVNFPEFPAEKTFPAPETVTFSFDNNIRVTWTVVPYAVQYIIYIKDKNNNMVEYIPTNYKYTGNNNIVYINIPSDVYGNENLNLSSYRDVGVCAISYNGIKSEIKFSGTY
jgi:hypothetical protein